MLKNEPQPMSYTKTNSEWLNDLNYKISKENIGQMLYDPEVGKDSLDTTPFIKNSKWIGYYKY